MEWSGSGAWVGGGGGRRMSGKNGKCRKGEVRRKGGIRFDG